MNEERLSIEELADAAGLTRRGIRFYVQQELLPAPHGIGRGKHYDQTHLSRLRQIRDLQAAGHSLEEIRQILAGKAGGKMPAEKAGESSAPLAAAAPALCAELWRRLRIVEGLELSFDAARFNPSVEQLIALRAEIAAAFKSDNREPIQEPGEDL